MFKRTTTFLDANKNRVELTSEITTRNKYPEYTSSCTIENSGGQAFDKIAPANDSQKYLLYLHENLHLKNLNKLCVDVNKLIKTLHKTFDETDKDLPSSDVSLLDNIPTSLKNQDPDKLKAIIGYCNVSSRDEIELNTYGENSFSIQGVDYLVCNDEEADEECKEYIKESAYLFNPNLIISHSSILDFDDSSMSLLKTLQEQGNNEAVKKLIDDREGFVEDAIDSDGRGSFLSMYDGQEEEHNNFYFFRQ